jgi:hypothetical protein
VQTQFLRRGKRTITLVRRYYPLRLAIDQVARSGKYLQAKNITMLEDLAKSLDKYK